MYRKYHKAPWYIHGNKLVVLLLYTLKNEIATMDFGNVIIDSNQTVLCFFSTAVMGVFSEIGNLNYYDSVLPFLLGRTHRTNFQASRSKYQD